MIFDKLFTQSSILGAALHASEYKNQVILNNIANADTPGFKSKDVKFEGILDDALKSAEHTGKLDLDSAVAKLYSPHENYNYRMDENNVDIEVEMINFYKNSTKYDVIANSMISNGNRFNAVLNTMK